MSRRVARGRSSAMLAMRRTKVVMKLRRGAARAPDSRADGPRGARRQR